MVRAPCCEKMGLKKGPWTPEEDQILIRYIHQYGHGNWRALPKQAGLLRCGKSCRLRWTNYLRPDIKRGNFSREEEETIIKLHEMLGNRWSAIAARLPGRTDNEIKNVWHTHLKKRLKQQNQTTPETNQHSKDIANCDTNMEKASNPVNFPSQSRSDNGDSAPLSPQQSSSDFSSKTDFSVITIEINNNSNSSNLGVKEEHFELPETFPEMDENFWSEALSMENSGMLNDFPAVIADPELQFPFSPMEPINDYSLNNIDNNMDFWNNLLMRAEEELPELLEF